MENKELNFFSKCNLTTTCEYTIKKSNIVIKLPFYFKLENIYDVTYNNDNWLSESLSYYKAIKSRDNIKEVLKDAYIELFFTEECVEGCNMIKVEENKFIFKDTNELYKFLSEYLRLTDTDFRSLFSFIIDNREKLMKEYVEILETELEIGSKSTTASEAFMLLRCALELGNKPIFPENRDKCISEFSWRELMIQRTYLGRKCEIEKMLMDEIKDKNEKGNGGGK